MKPLLPLVVLMAVGIAGCSKSDPKPDPYAKYRDAQLTRGMKIADIKQQFGEPDHFDEWWSKTPDDTQHYEKYSYLWYPEYTHHVEKLKYGAFGAHSQAIGHTTRHRLSMTFVDGELYSWHKSTPINRK